MSEPFSIRHYTGNFVPKAILVALLVSQQTLVLAIKQTAGPSLCINNQYFDTSQLSCVECTPGSTVPATDRLSCQCAPGYYLTNSESFIPECTQCAGANSVASRDQTKCMTCGGAAVYDQKLKDCICPQMQVVVESGSQKTCTGCSQNAYPGPNNRVIYQDECQRCPVEGMTFATNTNPWQCVCNAGSAGQQYTQAGDMCFYSDLTLSYASSSKQIEYKSVETRNRNDGVQQLTSGALEFYQTKNAIRCKDYGDPTACQSLANLCVLNLYNPNAAACKFYRQLVEQTPDLAYKQNYNDPGYKKGIPWLYYQQPADQVIYKDQRVKFRASFTYQNAEIGVISKLSFKLAVYELDGTFKGFEDLSNQLILCARPSEELNRVFDIGTTVEISCNYDLAQLVSTKSFEMPRKANRFYELYLVDYNGNLVDVPIKITNINSEAGDFPNIEDNENRWILTRRFFIFDTKSGIAIEDWPQGPPTVIRYAKEMILKINLDTKHEEMINVPYLQIEYRERTGVYIQENSLTQVSFNSEYILSTDNFWQGASIIFWIFFVIFILLLLIATAVLTTRPQLEDNFCANFWYMAVKTYINALDIFSTLMFWYLFLMTGYWFVFFKLQERVYCFLPELDSFKKNYEPYDILFGLVCSSKLVYVAFKIKFEQTAYDIYLIDWERPKVYQKAGDTHPDKADVSAWRWLFLCNELNELQNMKVISTDFTLLTYAVMMEGFGMVYWTSHSPNLETKNYDSPLNYPLFFFVTTLIIYLTGILQYVFRYFPPVYNKMPLKHVEFIDLCSISNISVLMFDESCHGYYIHGRSPYGQAEVSAKQLALSLEFESSGKAHMRGITETNPELQTFEIFMARELMRLYRSEYMQEVDQVIQNKNSENTRNYNNVQRAMNVLPQIPTHMDIDELEVQRKKMNKLMIKHVEQVRMKPEAYIRDRSWFERLLNRAPDDLAKANGFIMYKDRWGAFIKYMLMGMDFDFLMLDVLIITFMERETQRHEDTVTSRVALAIMITYTLDCLLFWMMSYYGKRNLSKHTLADEAFLI